MDTSLLRAPASAPRRGAGCHKSVSRICSRLLPISSSKSEVSEPTTSTSSSSQPHSPSGRVRAMFKASKLGRQPIQEAQRPLSEYMALPASQYSVLDARRIERVDDSTFCCYVGELRFLNWSVEPVITVSVEVEECGCTIRLLSCKLQGSRFVEAINDKFTATMENVVRWRVLPDDTQTSDSSDNEAACNLSDNDALQSQQDDNHLPSPLSVSSAAPSASSSVILPAMQDSHVHGAAGGPDVASPSLISSAPFQLPPDGTPYASHSTESHAQRGPDNDIGTSSAALPALAESPSARSTGGADGSKEIISNTTIQVDLEVPSWAGALLSVPSLERVGSGVMQNVLNVMVPRFLTQLRTDYELWASGDKSRRPVGEL